MSEPPSSPNALQSLPQDWWVQILDQISPSDRKSIVATCRGLRVSSEASVYRQVSIDWLRPPLKRVLDLFRVIYKRPDLASCIHHVSMIPSKLQYPANDQMDKWVPPQIDGDWNQLFSHFHKEVNAAKEIIIMAQFPSPTKWINALEHGDPYAFVAVLLSQLHNLRSLQLDYTFVWQSGFPGLMIRHALLSAPEKTLSRFSELSVVEYGMNVPQSRVFHELGAQFIDGFPACDQEQFTGWFYLPALNSLEIWLQNLEEVKDELAKPTEASKLAHLAQLERLVLAESFIDENEARILLSHLSSLKSLHLGLVYPSQDRELGFNWCSPRPPLKEPGVLLKGLMSVKDTVEHLSIGMELCPTYYCTEWGSDKRDNGTPEQSFKQCPGILKHFSCLKTAELPAPVLFGWYTDAAAPLSELLPSTLQKLSIRDEMMSAEDFEWDDNAVASAILKFLPTAKRTAPLLDTITLRSLVMGKGNEWDEDSARKPRNLSEELGLNVHINKIMDNTSPGLWTTHRELYEATRRDCQDLPRTW
ncbi:hypothetical protein N7492_006458 [Penicillium capsulatum]|uniref:F-box domain-containing protein n=1 Tax=Penicillium capsulatum TaxID=69766 RepID=A0A9W9I090_9EURO|nr:hypothetical protein N7492_006458 [Penicillium capsulatum]KAJ6116298.1 hypothetical protein N7512_006023 [Penicillium capsulatum]